MTRETNILIPWFTFMSAPLYKSWQQNAPTQFDQWFTGILEN